MLQKLAVCIGALAFGFILLACNGAPTQTSRPSVIIASPPSGSTYTIGEEVIVQSTASDPARIVRVELIVDGVTVRQDASPVATGQEQFSLLQAWTADKPGPRNLIVRATNAQGVTSESGVSVTVQPVPAQPAAPQATSAPATNAQTDIPTQTALPSPVVNPVITVLVTATGEPTQAATNTPASTTTNSEATSCTDNAAFVADVTVPDGTNFSPGAAFTKTWRVRNTGTCVWTNHSLVFGSGAQMAANATYPIFGTAPGATTDISVPMTAPASPGNYKATWRLQNAQGTFFGPSLTVVINVASSNATANATATNTTIPQTLPAAASCSGQPNNFTFTASKPSVTAGQAVTLNWGAINNASIAVLNGGQFNQQGVGAPGSITTTPTSTTTYTLTATCNNGGGTRTNSVTVTVSGNAPPPQNTNTPTVQSISGCVNPKIGLFFGNPATISAGQTVTLSWSGVVGADYVQMGGLILQGVESGSVTRSPTTTTTFELEAVCKTTGQTAVKQLTITVTGGGGAACSGQPGISSFTASATTIQAGQSVTFNWGAVTNADQIIFDNPAPTGGGSVTAPGTITLSPTTTTTYNLIATCTLNGSFSAKSITVTVNP